jgi:hypothetical protein
MSDLVIRAGPGSAALQDGIKKEVEMRSLLAFSVSISLLGMPSLSQAGPDARVDFKAYYACFDQEAAAAVKREVNRLRPSYELDIKRIAEHIVTVCTARHSNGVVVQQSDSEIAELCVKDALNSVMRADLQKQQSELRSQEDKQAALDAPKLEIEGTAASRAYGDCLFGHAIAMAISSPEAAEIIREAAFASCQSERNAILEIHRRYKDRWFSEEAMDVADQRLAGTVLLEIIKKRAIPVQPSPPPTSKAPDGKI